MIFQVEAFTFYNENKVGVMIFHDDSSSTGLAKPGPVIETFCSDELVSRYVKLDGVVTLVDSKHAMQHLNEVKPRFVVNEAVEQVAYADRIILNKVELSLMFNFNNFFSYNFVWVYLFWQLVPRCKVISVPWILQNYKLLWQIDLVNEDQLEILRQRIKV